MFRERILHWARVFDLVTVTLSAIVVLTKARAGSLVFARASRTKPVALQIDRDFQRDLIARRAYNEAFGRIPVAR